MINKWKRMFYTFIIGAMFAVMTGGVTAMADEVDTEWNLTDGVLRIESDAGMKDWYDNFEGDKGQIKHVVLEEGVTAIPISAFRDCNELTDISIPDSVKKIGVNAFHGLASLVKITLPANLTEIESSTFSGCTGLKTVTLPENLKIIGPQAFAGCSSLTAIDIPEQTESIGNYAFDNCRGLTSVIIPQSVKTLGERVFANCNGLAGVLFEGNAPDSIGTRVFTGDFPIYMLEGATGFNGVDWDDYGEQLKVKPDGNGWELTLEGALTIMSDAGMADWVTVGADLREDVRSLELRSGITYIGDDAFHNSVKLNTVTLPDSVKTIGDNAFKDCTALTEVLLSDGLTSIGDSAFWGCDRLVDITFPASLEIIHSGAFINCSRLAEVTFLGTAPELPNATVFFGVDSCFKIIVPNYDTSFTAGNWVYYKDNIVHKDDIPGDGWYLSAEGVLTIEDNTGMNNWAKDDENPDLNPNKLYGDKVKEIILQDGVNVILQEFQNCTTLQRITISDSVTYIGYKAFMGCTGLTEVTISANVELIGGEAFSGCTGLKTATFIGDAPAEFYDAFTDTSQDLVIYIPAGAKGYTGVFWEAYKDKIREYGPGSSGDSHSSGGSGGGGSTAPKYKTGAPVTKDGQTTVTIELIPSSNGGIDTATIPASVMEKAVNSLLKEAKAQETIANLEVKVKSSSEETTKVKVDFQAEALKTMAASERETKLTLSTVLGTMELDRTALRAAVDRGGTKMLLFTIAQINPNTLTEKQAVRNATGVELFLSTEGKAVTDVKDGTIKVYVPYNRKVEEEQKNIAVSCLGEDGSITAMKSSYDDRKGQVMFETNSFSKYIITSNKSATEEKTQEVTAEEESWKNPYSDVTETAWYFDAVRFTAENDLFSGISENSFSPDSSMTRAMLVTVLNRLSVKDYDKYGIEAETPIAFDDVPEDMWYSGAVKWAGGAGMISGMDKNRFAPEDVVTREQLAVILYNYAKAIGMDTPTEGMAVREFTDADEISEWAKDAVRWAIGQGILSGKGSDIIDPKGMATRAEAAAMLQRFMNE